MVKIENFILPQIDDVEKAVRELMKYQKKFVIKHQGHKVEFNQLCVLRAELFISINSGYL